MMTKDDIEYLRAKIENEGFDYCFLHYSNFKEIDDNEFHKLREAYIKAANNLNSYIESFVIE